MAKNIVGIDISDFSIEALALEKRKNSFRVESYARFRLSPEIVEDGRILDKQKLKDAILKMFANAKPVAFNQSRKVFLSIPESQTFSRVLSLPKHIKDKSLSKIALDKAEEIIPESIDKLTAVVKILPASEKHKHVFYSAAETEVLHNFISVFKELNIEVAGITTETISSFAGLKINKDKKNILVLDLGARTTIASIFTKECLCSSINIDIGGDNITKALVKKLNISYNQAQDKKRQVGLSPDGDGETMLVAQGQLQPLVDELKVFIKYWQDINKKTIEQVVLVGGLSQMKGADKYFGDNLNVPTQLGQSFIDVKDLPDGFAFSKYINALGLAKLAHKGTDIDFYKKLPKNKKDNKNEELEVKTKKSKASKFSKNDRILITIILILFLSVIAIFIFRDKLTSLIYKDKQPIVQEEIVQDSESEQAVDEEEKVTLKIEEPIVVSSVEYLGKDNFILGELYEISVDRNIINPELNYADLLTALKSQSNVDILHELNKEYDKEDYYTIPQFLSYEVTQINPPEVSFIAGNELTATVLYSFLSFKELDLRNILVNKNPVIKDRITSIYYGILRYEQASEEYSFDLEAIAEYK